MATKTSNAPVTESGIAEQLEALRAQLQALEKSFNQRIADLETKVAQSNAQAASAPEPEVTPEILAIISAAVTSFLGKKVRIRSARVVRPSGLDAWTQQGRVVIQASHNLAR